MVGIFVIVYVNGVWFKRFVVLMLYMVEFISVVKVVWVVVVKIKCLIFDYVWLLRYSVCLGWEKS